MDGSPNIHYVIDSEVVTRRCLAETTLYKMFLMNDE